VGREIPAVTLSAATTHGDTELGSLTSAVKSERAPRLKSKRSPAGNSMALSEVQVASGGGARTYAHDLAAIEKLHSQDVAATLSQGLVGMWNTSE
jgi:hypothetical protein